MSSFAGDAAFVLALGVMTAASLYFGGRIRVVRLPMQWGLHGQPTWFAPRRVALWGPLAFALLVRLIIFAAVQYAPDKVHGATLGLVLFSVIVAGSHFFHLAAIVRWQSRDALQGRREGGAG